MGRFTSRSGGQNCTQPLSKQNDERDQKWTCFFFPFCFVFRGYRRKEELRLLLSLWLFHSFVSLSAAIAEPSNIIQHLIHTRLALSVSLLLSFSILLYILISIRFFIFSSFTSSVCLSLFLRLSRASCCERDRSRTHPTHKQRRQQCSVLILQYTHTHKRGEILSLSFSLPIFIIVCVFRVLP